VTPDPICTDADPELLALLPLDERRVSLKLSANSVLAPLKAVVFTLAMLLPITSIWL
ncbi:MAG: hypothetical protein JWN25_521, partial [Verrucomicrobiales bacterium]|nr:hypothetical protein [Verrucomicrobiales bacterium]